MRVCIALVLISATVAAGEPLTGMIYALCTNGSTNELNFIAANLLTFEIAPRGGPLGPGRETIGQAAAFDASTGIYWQMLYEFDPRPDAFVLAGFNVSSGSLTYRWDTKNLYKGGSGKPLLLEEIFVTTVSKGVGQLLVVGRELGQPGQVFLDVASLAGTATLRGVVNVSGADMAFDEANNVVYESVSDGNDEDSGSFVIVSLSPPKVERSFALENHFGFATFDPKTEQVFGLTLQAGGPNGYMRNVTALKPQASGYSAVSHGDLGDLFVVLEDGPKAFDASTRRAFYMLGKLRKSNPQYPPTHPPSSNPVTHFPGPWVHLSTASGPFAEFEIVSVDVDEVPVKPIETVGLCGFVGYCPDAFAFSATAS